MWRPQAPAPDAARRSRSRSSGISWSLLRRLYGSAHELRKDPAAIGGGGAMVTRRIALRGKLARGVTQGGVRDLDVGGQDWARTETPDRDPRGRLDDRRHGQNPEIAGDERQLLV